jgi:glycosyltransferase involved in cell wall biosynthesis
VATVSVVIPAYNAARFIEAAVDSVLAQSFQDIEVLVVDDGSTDETEALVSRYGSKIRYLRQNNGGVAAARNRGIEESDGRYVAFLDSDDAWLPKKLEHQITALERARECRACYSAIAVCTESLIPLTIQRSWRRGSALQDLLLLGNVIGSPSSVLCDRRLFSAIGSFDPNLSQCADWDMWVRMATVTEFVYLDEPLVTYRQHGSNMSRDPALLERDSVTVLEKAFNLSNVPPRLKSRQRDALGRNYRVLAGTYFHARRYHDCFRCITRAVELSPRQLGYLAGFPYRVGGRLLGGARPTGQWR